MTKTATILSLIILTASAGDAGAVTIFDDDFNGTASANQPDLVAGVGTGSWVEVQFDTSVIDTGASDYLSARRGDYDYTAVFSQYGSASGGGTITMDLSFLDSVHDYNTIAVLEGTTELFRVEVQTDDGGVGGTDAQINLVGATTQNIASGIRETAVPNRTFEFTLDAGVVELSITGDGLGAALTASVNYANTPLIGPDRIQFFKNDVVGNPDRGQLQIDNVDADFSTTVARDVLIDFNDGNASNGIHDSAVRDGDFSNQPDGAGINPPWQSLSGGEEFGTNLPSSIGSTLNGVMVDGRVYAVDTGHTLALGDVFGLEYYWRDAFQWDAGDSVEMVLYYTDTNAIGGIATDFYTLNSGNRDRTIIWEGEYGTSAAFADTLGVGKALFAKLQTNSQAGEFARIDNIYLEVVNLSSGNPSVPEPSTFILATLGLLSLGMTRRRRRR